MAVEALILLIKELEVWETRASCLSIRRIIPCFSDGRKSEMETKVIDELKMIVDILRVKKLREGRRLNYLISDLIEMAQDALYLYQHNGSHNEMESIKSWIKEIKMRLLKFSDDGAEASELSNIRSENAGEGGNEDEDVVGLEKQVQLLLYTQIMNRWIVVKDPSWIFLIKGTAGIGKTTLARQLYNHADVIAQFNRRAWVCVSSELTHKEVLMKLIQQVVDSEQLPRDLSLEYLDREDNTSLQRMLYQYLLGMRYFIVLDDLPKEMRLDSILNALPYGDGGSRLLVTSRIRSIQLSDQYIHEMKPLDFEHGWQLFLNTVFRGNESTSENKSPKQMEKVVTDMFIACGGIPLAIKQMARQFAQNRRSGSEWGQLFQPTHSGASLGALISPLILELDRYKASSGLEDVINDLRMVVHLVREKKFGEGNRLYYIICDLISMAQDLLNKSFTKEDIETVRSWIREIKSRMLDMGVDGAEVASSIRLKYVGDGDDEDLVGMGEDVELLLRRVIFNEEKGFLTCMVTGMVGIGKTTLVRQVYNHADVIRQFDSRAWVNASSDISYKEVFIKLIQQVVDNDDLERDFLSEKMKLSYNLGLRQMLHKHLKGMRYFIVLDDPPKAMRLEYILKALPHEDNGSRLVVASPSLRVGPTVSYTHRMKTLDSDKGWQLFLKTISSANKFTSDQLEFPKHLKKMGKDKLRKCGGLPLAIKQVGRQLAKKRRLGGEWVQLLESIDLSPILQLLELSYKKLDQELKSCFLHMAFFKENTTLRREKLEQIWVIGGNVSGDDYQIRSYVSKLAGESMIDVMDKTIDGEIRTLSLNVILHSLSIKKAEEEIDFEILRNDGNNRPSQNPRHRVIICSREKFNYSMNHGNKHLVSLFFHGGGYLELGQSYWNSFEELKILDLEDFGIKILPESISTLIELRYLGLRNNYIQELPHSLGSLKKLEVLDIAQNFMMDVPDIIWKMGSLVHLYMSDVICRKPLKIEALKNLETLTYISFDNWTYELSCLQMMTSLRKLGIVELDGNSDVSKLFVSLGLKCLISHLILRGHRFRSMPCLDELGILTNVHKLKLDGLLPRLPKNFPRFLIFLKLVNSSLDEDPMPILEKLTWLRQLKLRNAYTGKEMVILPNGFSDLRILCIEESWNLRIVQVGEGAMQKLNHLEIKNCPKLETLPGEIVSKTDMQSLTMVTTKNIATKFQKSALISKLKLVEIKP